MKDPAFFNRQNIVRLFHHTKLASFPGTTSANVTGIVISKDETTAAGTDLLLDPDDGLGKVSCLLRSVAQHPESKTLCGLTSHAWET